MIDLPIAISDVDVPLALEPEELAGKMLLLVRTRFDQYAFNVRALRTKLWDYQYELAGRRQYPKHRREEVDLAIAEAIAWLVATLM